MNKNNLLDILLLKYKVILNIVVIEELDHLKKNDNSDTAYKAQKAIKNICKNLNNKNLIIDIDKQIYPALISNINYNQNDDIIVSCALYHHSLLMTDDINLAVKANILKVEIFNLDCEQKNEYTGYIDKVVSDEELSIFFTDKTNNIFNCLTNQFIILRNNNNQIIYIARWNGFEYQSISYKSFNSEYSGYIEPINLEQKLAFDILQNDNITIKVLTGKQGTGKDFLMITNALHLINNKKYKKILWVRNNIEVKDTKPIGFLPNDINDKLLPFAEIIADHVGGKDKLRQLISVNKVEIEHLGFIRGRDIKDSIIICTEAENMTTEQIQLLIGRVGKNSTLWINGDYSQVDSKVFKNNNGLISIIEHLKGQDKFGFVKLKDVERSETAKLADLLNE